MNTRAQQLEAIDRLLTIMDELREQCPWDRKQTFESLRHLTIEETYELCDAILDRNLEEIKNELGDLLLHIAFYSKLGSEEKAFVGFDWEHPEQVWDKVQEELAELNAEVKNGSKKSIEAEFGDVLFSMINYSRFLKINPDTALERTNQKFTKRFQYLEQHVQKIGKTLHEMSLDEMEVIWQEAKKVD